MATKDAQSAVLLLLLSSMSVLSYLQFVIPGGTEADSSPVHVSQLPSGPYPYWPNRTVDGNFSQNIRACLHTADKEGIKEAWLRIDLKTVKSVKAVKFWYRADRGSMWKSTERLKGYSIRVSNSSDVLAVSTDACFTDNRSTTLPILIDQVCKASARYIWFYQTHAYESTNSVPILEICEVQVFGCETGTYGINCSRTCGHCKNSDTCDIDDGKCDKDGCAKPGYDPPSCNKCKPGFYGPGCSLNCSTHCRDISCNRVTGECLNGCTPGYQAPNCNMPCPHGYYGDKCAMECGNCWNIQTCDNVNGTCTYGCDEGFKEDLCKTSSV